MKHLSATGNSPGDSDYGEQHVSGRSPHRDLSVGFLTIPGAQSKRGGKGKV
jgi:hypothetical protein